MKRYLLFGIVILLLISGVSATPSTDYTASSYIGATPFGVNFTDTSTGSPTTWAWYFGDENYIDAWVEQNATVFTNADSGLFGMASASNHGILVVAGGHDEGGLSRGTSNTTWSSSNNGITWTQQTLHADWQSRDFSSMVVESDGTLVLMGGYDYNDDFIAFNDVWNSTDNGATWTLVNSSSGWVGRYDFATVVMPNNDIIVMGGNDASPDARNDTWKSTDSGVTWTEQNASSGWNGRYGHRAVVTSDNKIVLMGGYDGSTYHNDTWISSDEGATWIQQSTDYPFPSRSEFGSVILPNDYIMIMGGTGEYGTTSDVWLSPNNGITWIQRYPADWEPRQLIGCVIQPDGSVIVLGGTGSNSYTDVWRMPTAGSNIQNPYHRFDILGLYPVLLQTGDGSGISNITHDITAGAYTVPHANFDWNVTNISFPNELAFTDTSTDNPIQWTWFFGDEPYDDTWVEQTASVPYSPRLNEAYTLLPNQNIIMAGGSTAAGSDYKNDVWLSSDKGITWKQQTNNAAWYPRVSPSMVSLSNGHIVLTGGSTLEPGWKKDAWVSSDEGVTWTEQTADMGWSGGTGHTMVVMPDDTIILMGGIAPDGHTMDEVWFSQNEGVTWGLLNNSPGWYDREGICSVVTQYGDIILMGGAAATITPTITFIPLNDIWKSSDYGQTWTEVKTNAEWSTRAYSECVAQPDGSIIINGGTASDTGLWRSIDNGTSWTEVNSDPGIGTRFVGSMFGMGDGSIVSVGGMTGGGTPYSNAWRVQPDGSNDQNPTHNYASPGTYSVTLQDWNNGYKSIIHKLVATSSSYYLNVTFKDSLINAIIPNVTVIDSLGHTTNTTDGTYSTITGEGITLELISSSDGYNTKISSFLMDSDRDEIINLTRISGTSNTANATLMNVYPKYVTFHVKEGWGTALSDVDINIQGISTSTGNWDWIVTLLGIPLNEVPVNNTAMSQTTDTLGRATFYMVPTAKYNVSFTKAGYTIPSMILVPQDNDYIVYATGTEQAYYEHGVNELEAVNITINRFDVNESYAYLNVTYIDTTGHTTGGVIDVLQSSEIPGTAPTLITSWPVTGNSFTNSTAISHTTSKVFGYVNATITHSDFGIIHRTYPFQFNTVPVSFLGFGANIQLLVALGIMLFTTMLAGATHARQVIFVVAIEGWIFDTFGWFDAMIARGVPHLSIWIALTAMVVFAFLANAEQRKRREKY
jgi:PKD repeat protein